MNKWQKIALTSLVLVFGVIRFGGIMENPPAIFSDEVDAGYQAFVLNRCGGDYFGNKWPTHFHSFADYRTPLFVYTLAFVQKLGIEPDLAIRLPAWFFGMMTILMFFWLVMITTKNYWLSLAGMAIMAINPWWWHFTRGGWEVTGMILSLILVIISWLKYLESKKTRWFYLTLLMVASGFYFYATAKLMVILLGGLGLVVWKKEVIQIPKKYLITGILLFTIVSLPMLQDTVSGKAGFRFNYISIFTDPTITKTVDFERYLDSMAKEEEGAIGVSPGVWSKVAHNKFTVIGRRFVDNYLKSVSSEFLFIKGDGNLRQGFGSYGYFFLIDGVLVLLGMAVARRKIDFFMLGWLALAPIPNALTRDSEFPNGTRLLLMLIPMLYLIILGVRKFAVNKWLMLVTGFIYLIFFADFWFFYNTRYPGISARFWHYGISEAIAMSQNKIEPEERIFYSNSYEPMLPFWLYYTKYLPDDGSCIPSQSINSYKDDLVSGTIVGNKTIFGVAEWGVIENDRDLAKDTLFVVTGKDRSILNKLNRLEIVEVGKTARRYPEAEQFYLIRIK